MSQDSPGIGIRNIFQKNLLIVYIYHIYVIHSTLLYAKLYFCIWLVRLEWESPRKHWENYTSSPTSNSSFSFITSQAFPGFSLLVIFNGWLQATHSFYQHPNQLGIPGHTKTVSSRSRTSLRSSNTGYWVLLFFWAHPLENGKIREHLETKTTKNIKQYIQKPTIVGNIYSSKKESKVENLEN